MVTPWARCTPSMHAGVQEGKDGLGSASPRWLGPFLFLQATLLLTGAPVLPQAPPGLPQDLMPSNKLSPPALREAGQEDLQPPDPLAEWGPKGDCCACPGHQMRCLGVEDLGQNSEVGWEPRQSRWGSSWAFQWDPTFLGLELKKTRCDLFLGSQKELRCGWKLIRHSPHPLGSAATSKHLPSQNALGEVGPLQDEQEGHFGGSFLSPGVWCVPKSHKGLFCMGRNRLTLAGGIPGATGVRQPSQPCVPTRL